PCEECRKILCLQIFHNALCHPPPKIQNWKYTPKEYRSELLGKAYMQHMDVQEFMEKFAKRGIAGHYKDQSAFLGMMDAIMKVEDQLFEGKGLKNMKY
ncbi:hypothetical protein PILCRDRAFT_37664, partial [Piloderma croceum F 1598]